MFRLFISTLWFWCAFVSLLTLSSGHKNEKEDQELQIKLHLSWPAGNHIRNWRFRNLDYVKSFFTLHGLWIGYPSIQMKLEHRQEKAKKKNVVFRLDDEIYNTLKQYWIPINSNTDIEYYKGVWLRHGLHLFEVLGFTTPDEYFSLALKLYKMIDLDNVLLRHKIYQSKTKGYSYEEYQRAFQSITKGKHVFITCYSHFWSDKVLTGATICFNTNLDIIDCEKDDMYPGKNSCFNDDLLIKLYNSPSSDRTSSFTRDPHNIATLPQPLVNIVTASSMDNDYIRLSLAWLPGYKFYLWEEELQVEEIFGIVGLWYISNKYEKRNTRVERMDRTILDVNYLDKVWPVLDRTKPRGFINYWKSKIKIEEKRAIQCFPDVEGLGNWYEMIETALRILKRLDMTNQLWYRGLEPSKLNVYSARDIRKALEERVKGHRVQLKCWSHPDTKQLYLIGLDICFEKNLEPFSCRVDDKDVYSCFKDNQYVVILPVQHHDKGGNGGKKSSYTETASCSTKRHPRSSPDELQSTSKRQKDLLDVQKQE